MYFFTVATVVSGIAALTPDFVKDAAKDVIVYEYIRIREKCSKRKDCNPEDSEKTSPPSIDPKVDKEHATGITTYDMSKMPFVPIFIHPDSSFIKIETMYGSVYILIDPIRKKLSLPTDDLPNFNLIGGIYKYGLPVVLPGPFCMNGIENNSIIEKFYKSLKNGDKIEINGTLNFKLDGKLAAEQAKTLKLHKD